MPKIGSFFYKPKKRDEEAPVKRWSIFRIIKKVLAKTCMALGAIMLFWIVLSVFFVLSFKGKGVEPLPSDMVLVLRIEKGLVESNAAPGVLDPFPVEQPTVRGVIDAINHASMDKRVRGLVVSLQNGFIGVSHTQELRVALQKFKKSGKFAKIYAPSYMDAVGGLSRYYFASAFDEIWMQPVGLLSISGINAEMPFAKDALDKLGVSADFEQREEYKSAMESFTRNEISPENRETLASLFGNITDQMMADITNDRKFDPVYIKNQIDRGVLTGDEALSARLIDRLDYADVMVSEIREKEMGNPKDKTLEFISLERYAGDFKDKKKQGISDMPDVKAANKSNVALIKINGTIVDHSDTPNSGGANKVTEAINQASEDNNIEAIVVRVDSPGGSPTASETIRRALIKAKENGKKVIVSMGSVAASGGYWVSADADKIYASRATITGSIGVIMGKFEMSGIWDKLGIKWQGVQIGENADFWSFNKPFDEGARARLNILIDDVYDAFIARVAKGRNLTPEQVKSVAKGRAWTGEQAQKNGLVDELGGLEIALNGTAKMLGHDDINGINIIPIPRELSKIEQLLELLEGQVTLSPFMKSALPFMARLDNAAVLSDMNMMAYDPVLDEWRR